MRRGILITVLAACVFLFFASTASAASFAGLMHRAEEAPDRDSKVEYLKKALAARPGHPDNVFIEFKIASQLSQHVSPEYGQGVRRRDALPYYDSVLENYDYDAYYDLSGDGSGNFYANGQNVMVNAATRAGAIRAFLLDQKEEQKGREYQLRAMEMLESTFRRRRADWLALEKAEPPPILNKQGEDMLVAGLGGLERIRAGYESELEEWRERRRRAANGNVLNRHELRNVETAVYYYGAYKRDALDGLTAMNELIERFPDTPIATRAEKVKAIALESLRGQVGEELDEAFLDPDALEIQSPPEPAAPESAPASTEDPARPSPPAREGPVAPAAPARENAPSTAWPYVVPGVLVLAAVAAAALILRRTRADC